MGLLDRWKKKKEEEMLNNSEKRTEDVKVEKKVEVVGAEKTKAKKTAVKVKKVKKTEQKEKDSTVKSKSREVKMGEVAHTVLIRPLVTEKCAVMESQNKYGFLVARNANKQQIKKSIEELYGVMPVAVNVVNVNGRHVRFGSRKGRRSDYRKAIVTLAAGKSITIHEGV